MKLDTFVITLLVLVYGGIIGLGFTLYKLLRKWLG